MSLSSTASWPRRAQSSELPRPIASTAKLLLETKKGASNLCPRGLFFACAPITDCGIAI